MKKSRKILLIITCHLVGLIFLVIIGGAIGIRVVYNPAMSIDWTAVTAIGTWCTAIVPIFLVFLTAYISNLVEKERQNIVQSNLHLYKAIKSSSSSQTDEENMLERVYNYICIGLVCTTEDITEFMKLDNASTMRLLSQLESIGKIETISSPKQSGSKNQMWRIKSNNFAGKS